MTRRLTALVMLIGLVAVSCTVTTTPSTTTTTFPPGATAPVVNSFAPDSAIQTAPAVVALKWSVADPQGTSLTCTIDGNGDGTVDVTVTGCQGTGSRNVVLPTVGNATARLTVSDGTETATATTPLAIIAGPTEPFNIEVRPVAPLDPAVQAAFDAAAARWESIVVRGIPDIANANLAASTCLAGSAPINSIDDLIIDVEVAPNDGPGGILGSAGPCIIGSGDQLARVGEMSFDSADVANLLAAGQFDEVVLHEMGHILGIGTLWDQFPGLTSGFTGTTPRFLGAKAVAEWNTLGRTGTVPVEADGGAGTAYAHWDETTFDNELMTGYLNSGANPLSRMTIASLGDLGYHVDVSQADPYTLPGAGLRAGADGVTTTGRELLTRPIGSV